MPSFENADTSFLSESAGVPVKIIAPTTGSTYAMKAGERAVYVNNSGTLAALTIELPKMVAGLHGQTVWIAFKSAITALTLQDGYGNALTGAPASANAGAVVRFRWLKTTQYNVGWVIDKDYNNTGSAQSSPSNPTGTTSTTAVMMGLAGAFTPKSTGRVLIMLSGDIKNSTSTDGATVQLAYGTGAAPANAAAATGTTVGGKPAFVAAANNQTVPFSVQAVVSGLTLGTAIWIDAQVAAVTGGTASIENLSLSVQEF